MKLLPRASLATDIFKRDGVIRKLRRLGRGDLTGADLINRSASDDKSNASSLRLP